jgi:hypothetical protein
MLCVARGPNASCKRSALAAAESNSVTSITGAHNEYLALLTPILQPCTKRDQPPARFQPRARSP